LTKRQYIFGFCLTFTYLWLNKIINVMNTFEFDNKLNQLSNILHSFAYNLTKDSEAARDLYQETAYRAIKNRDKFSPGTNFKAWLFTIMKNIFINDYRRRVKAKTIIDTTDNQYYINSGKNTVNNGAFSNIMLDELESMVGGLDDSTRVPFQMHYEGFKYQEIADKLHLPLGTVKSRIFFARKELKGMINLRYEGIAREV